MLIVLRSQHSQSTKVYNRHLSDLWKTLMLTTNRGLSYENFFGSSRYMDSKSCIIRNYKAYIIGRMRSHKGKTASRSSYGLRIYM